MFIYNIKVNGNQVFKIFFTIITIIILFLFIFGIYKIFNNANNNFRVSDKQKENIINIDTDNYTNVLKTVHENIDSYVGKEIKCSGYVYRLFDFKDNEFVLARDMAISSDYQSVIVGFLCNLDDNQKYQDNTWVEITGEITKGDYHGDIPIIKVKEIKQIEKPNQDYVYPPDDSFIPTNNVL